ncbi:MAG: rod shape-determining protein MreC [Cyanobacteria bacterium P01_A01_bin.17]
MSFLSRWWGQYRGILFLGVVSISTAWVVRQTQGELLSELYRVMTLPFQGNPAKQQQLIAAKTWEQQQTIVDLKAQNQNLKKLLDQPAVKQDVAIATPVIGRGADHWWQQITVGRGSKAGITEGAVVQAPGGLVGRVTEVTKHTSRVLLITDPSSRLGATISRSRDMGILRGQSNKFAIIEFFEKDPNVRVGDSVVTSSLSRLFPAGVPIGTVQSLKLEQVSKPQAIVELSVPIANLEWVSVSFDGQNSTKKSALNP